MNEVDTSKQKRKKLVFIFWGLILVLLLIALLLWLIDYRFYESTSDAYVEGNQVAITPLRDGFVKAIHTDDTYFVKQGQLLIELDQTDSKIALELTEKEYAKVIRDVCQYFHEVFVAKSEIDVNRAIIIKTIQDYQHRWAALDSEGVSLEDYQHSVAALRASYFTLKKDITRFNQALSFVQGTTLFDHPLVKAAAQKLRYAWVQLYRCNIFSPVSGLCAQRTIQVGMWTPSGKAALSIIPLDQIWVNANFKETQVGKMRLGQSVKVTSDLYGDDIVFDGVVLGLPGAAGNAFSLLPPQNLSGNWIKIVQRLPVRVGLNEQQLIEHPLRLGLSMEARVDLTNQDGVRVPDTSKNSPLYHTPIFENEDAGVNEALDEIFNANLDPNLAAYKYTPLIMEKEEVGEEIDALINAIVNRS